MFLMHGSCLSCLLNAAPEARLAGYPCAMLYKEKVFGVANIRL